METYLAHHGILGMKWGVRRYQNEDGTLTDAGKVRSRKLQNKAMKQYDKAEKAAKKRDKASAKYATKAAYYTRKGSEARSAAYNSPLTKVDALLGGGRRDRLLAKADAKLAKGEMYQAKIDKWQSRVDRGESLARKYLQKAEKFDVSLAGASTDLAKWKVDKLIAEYGNEPAIIRYPDGRVQQTTVAEVYKNMQHKEA